MLDDLVGCTLVGVERLAWQSGTEPVRTEAGPIRLIFDDGRGLFVEGKSDWTLGLVIAPRGDDAWRAKYVPTDDHGRWALRDSRAESPFAAAMCSALREWRPVFNAVQELGLTLVFGGRIR